MNRGKNRIPKILLVGLGRFGREHLDTWRRLEAAGTARLAGVVVRREQHRLECEARFGLPVYTQVPPGVLANVDGVDIVTPSETHAGLVRTFLPHTNVLVEKPLAMSVREALALKQLAQRCRRSLMVNHVYRFHPAIAWIKSMIRKRRDAPRMATAIMVNPFEPGVERLQAHLELLHPFDILDELFGVNGRVVFSESEGTIHRISLRFPPEINAIVQIGWKGDRRIRTLKIEYPEVSLFADLQDTAVVAQRRDGMTRAHFPPVPRPLEASLRAFAHSISGEALDLPDADTGHRIVRLALQSRARVRRERPRVAVIGGGIFGASCAIELAPYCDVTLIERHAELLTEATFHNQWRHHSGFHYPRSMETVQEIQATRNDFESLYGHAVVQNVVSYYCTSASATEITRERYLAVCRANGLEFALEDPPQALLDRNQVDLCLRTDEGVFHYYRLREAIEELLAKPHTVETLLNTEVTGAELRPNGDKTLDLRSGNRTRRKPFDYVVNATYANTNLLASWLRFPLQRLRFDLCEMLVLELPLPPVSVTILDGPFTSLVSTGQEKIFILSHIYESVLSSSTPPDGLPPEWGARNSNRANLLRQCRRYLPILAEARVLESRYATRAVQAFSEDFDGRPTVITAHGFGCWSVLGGKIVTSVSNARSIARQIIPDIQH